jgi:cbb3-type cytochrome oxidase subunit 3
MRNSVKIFYIIIILVELFFLVIFGEEFINFLINKEQYYVGSEAMIDKGGWHYKSSITFIFFNSIMIILLILSILVLFYAFRSKKKSLKDTSNNR